MIVLGINAYHADSAACLLRDGHLVAAAEEERFRRIKHWAGFPSQAISYCLKEAGVRLADVTHIAVNRNNRANLLRKIAYVATSRPGLKLVRQRLRNRAKWGSLAEELDRAFPGERFAGEVEHVEHHFAHLASAFFASSFPEALAVSVDGFGDFASAAWGMGEGTRLSLDGRILFPHSLGIFYQAMTQYLGFPHYGDEYKIMGLAPYGDRSLVGTVRRLLSIKRDGTFALELKYFRHHLEEVAYEWEAGSPTCGILYSRQLENLLGPARAPEQPLEDRHRNLAFATQAVFEEAFFALLNALRARYGTDTIVLAGGCAYNSVANGKLAARAAFKRSYLQSAAGDAGGAIGAAYAVWHSAPASRRLGELDHAYLGPSFANEQIGALLKSKEQELASEGCTVRRFDVEPELLETTANHIARGCVVGWFQGRMEWGPRALGNRSILCDPRRANMKEILNVKIKRRESFRPFAPSILREEVAQWFEEEDDVPFMLKVFPVREEKRSKVPAVTHVDGTGRLQTVHANTNPRYYALISAFHRLTGVPMVLNTSFNENEPVVCAPAEALDCFLRTKMDVLVLGDYLLTRKSERADAHTSAEAHHA
jgi:carbamoyltransferase